tara:strand:+ start:394 stop:900 length:507 start_codon:yes stop_codon:yes gene_type:complete
MSAKTETVANKTSTDGEVKTRKITVYSTQAKSSQTIETSATTWGELKAEMSNVGNVRAVIRETRNSLDTPSAKLPDQDFTLFMYPQRVKSGNEEIVAPEKRTVKVHKVKGADWDSTVDSEVDEVLGKYKEEFSEMVASVLPKDVILPTAEEMTLDKEALALAAEMGIE